MGSMINLGCFARVKIVKNNSYLMGRVKVRIPFRTSWILDTRILTLSDRGHTHGHGTGDYMLIVPAYSSFVYLEHCSNDLLGHKKDGVHAMMTLFFKRRTSFSS